MRFHFAYARTVGRSVDINRCSDDDAYSDGCSDDLHIVGNVHANDGVEIGRWRDQTALIVPSYVIGKEI